MPMFMYSNTRALPSEDALAADLQRGVVVEEVGERAPLRLVHVVAVGVLHDLDIGEVLQALDAVAGGW